MAIASEDITTAVNVFSDFLLRYFIALAAVGALAMALIELWKKLRDSRTRFHARAVTRWIVEARAALSRREGGRDVAPEAAYAQLLSLITGIDTERAHGVARRLLAADGIEEGRLWLPPRAEFAAFALDLERLMGHLQDAADLTLNTPEAYRELYYFLTAGAAREDIDAWLREADRLPSGDVLDRGEAKRRADLYARLHQVVKRRLDALQLYSGYRWATWNQFAANAVGSLVLFLVLLSLAPLSSLSLWLIVLLSLFGGMLAPIAKDIIVALQRVRSGG